MSVSDIAQYPTSSSFGNNEYTITFLAGEGPGFYRVTYFTHYRVSQNKCALTLRQLLCQGSRKTPKRLPSHSMEYFGFHKMKGGYHRFQSRFPMNNSNVIFSLRCWSAALVLKEVAFGVFTMQNFDQIEFDMSLCP